MYSIDIGNGFSVSYNGKQMHSVKSVVAEFNAASNKRPGEGHVVYQGKHYHTGEAAYKYDMYRAMAVNDKQVNGNITDSLILTLNLISPARGKISEKTEIIIQVPDTSSSYQHELVKLLNGMKSWTFDGKTYDTVIQVKQVYQEGFGSWYMAYRQNNVPAKGYTVVVDIGAGTVISSLIDNEYREVIRTDTYRKYGVIYLANLLVNDYELRYRNDGIIVRPDQIFTGFEDSSFQIGATGTNYKEFVDNYAPQWWKHIWSAVVNSYSEQFNRRDISRVLLTGGGSELVRPFIEAAKQRPGFRELFSIAANPLTDNVVGIYRHAEDHAAR